jgi:YtoQ family protein
MEWNVYLSGEIHSNWRDLIKEKFISLDLPIYFSNPETDHELSDDCGEKILGSEKNKFWRDHKSAKINAIKTKILLEQADIVIVYFGEKYKQWNAAFEAGYASALSKPLIIIHGNENQHALKEVDASALAVAKNIDEAIDILKYTISGSS